MIRKVLLTLIALCLICAHVSQAENDSEEIVVTARRMPDKTAQSPANISILKSDELRLFPFHDLSEALSLVPGVNIQGRGSFGQPASISIQGSNPAHTRIMVDGILLNTQGNAFANPALIPIGNIERIEVIKGPGSAVWGSSLGGVVNAITKSPPNKESKPQGYVTMAGGSGDINSWQESLELSGRTGRLGYLLWNNHIDTRGDFRKNSSLADTNLSGKLAYDLTNVMRLDGSYTYTSQNIGGYEFDTLGYGEDYRYFVRYGSLGLTLAPSDRFNLNATIKSSNQDSTITQFMVPSNALINSVATNNVFNGLDIVSAMRISEQLSLTSGIDIGQDKLNSDQMDSREKMNRYGVYTNYQWLFNKALTLEVGGRYDDNSAYGEQLSPSGGMVYRPGRAETNIKLSVSRAFNAPPLIYKYISGNPWVLANSELKAERGLVYEFTADAKPLSGLWVKAGLYRAEVDDLVSVEMIAPWTYQARNVDKTRRQGLETEVKYTLSDNLGISAGFEVNRIQDRLTDALIRGNGVPRTASHLGLEYQPLQPLQLSLLGNYRFWDEPPASQAKDRRFTWDARVSYDLSGRAGRQIAAFLNIINLFDQETYYNKLLPSPGRSIELGIKYSF